MSLDPVRNRIRKHGTRQLAALLVPHAVRPRKKPRLADMLLSSGPPTKALLPSKPA